MNGSELKQKFDEAVEYANSSSYPILVSSSYGKISPNGIVNCKKSDTVNLLFTADSDYQFIRWRVVDKSTGHEIENQDYISFDDENDTNTSFTLKKINPQMSFVVEPYCEIRPAIVSASPLYDSDGVYRDRRIIVMFDQNMSESSIYYDLDEQDELTAKGYTLLKDGNRGDKCYGYWDGVDKSSICFKNILITNRDNQSEILLKHYDPPYFDEYNTSVLRIDAKRDDAPPEATDILVTISKKIGAKIDTDIVSLSNNYKWNYYTNGNVDNDVPVFNSDFTVLFDDNVDDSRKTNAATEKTKFDEKDISFYKTKNLRQQKLFVKGGFYDGGSGPKSLKWKLYKLDSPFYPEGSNKAIKTGQIELSFSGTRAVAKTNGKDGVSISLGLADDEEGLYQIDFICSDKNELTATKSYYFVNDVKPPKNIKDISETRTAADYTTIKWKNATHDSKKISVIAKNVTDTTKADVKNDYDFDLDDSNLSKAYENTFSGLINQNEYYAKLVDIVGNESEEYFIAEADRTPPVNPNSNGSMNFEYGMGEVKCTWKATNDAEVAAVYVAPGPTGTSERHPVELSGGTTSHTWTNFYRRGKQYTFDIYYKDWSGNQSESVYTRTAHYVKSNGNIVINNNEIPYTSMIDINYTDAIPNNGWNGNVNWGFFRNNRGKPFKLDHYALGKYEATNKLWKASRAVTTFYGNHDSNWMPSSGENSENTDNFPVSRFNWFHAVQFCNNLSRLIGFEPVYSVILNNHITYTDFVEAEKIDWIPEGDTWNNFDNYNRYLFTDLTKDGYRMPTGAEWEFAGRGANPNNSANWNHRYGRSGYSHGDLMWGEWNSGNHNHAVGTKNANAAGFYDMSGNVAEWCNDRLRDGSDYVSTNADSRQNDGTYIINAMNNYDSVRIPYLDLELYLGTKWERLTMGGDRGSHSDNGRIIVNTAGKKAQEKFAYVGIRLCRTVKE